MALDRQTTVMLVDDHEIMRDGLREILERSDEFEVVGQAGDGVAAVRAAQTLRPDLIIMDVMMPLKSGIDACREITEMMPGTRVLMLTASAEEDAVIEAVRCGRVGIPPEVFGKGETPRHRQGRGGGGVPITWRSDQARVRRDPRNGEGKMARELEKLTPREREVLTLFSRGLTYAEIAGARGNRPLTIRNAVYGIQDKLGIETKQELVVWAVRCGLLDDYPVGPH